MEVIVAFTVLGVFEHTPLTFAPLFRHRTALT